jgi:4'-phosphopantetheinyl transferase
MNLCHHCYNNREIAEIVASADPLVSFTTLWTRKEAVLKLTGEGIDDNLPALFDGDLMERVRFQTVVDHDNAFVYTVCQYRLS